MIHGVEGARKLKATSAHFLSRKDIDEFSIVLNMVSLSHFAECSFDNLFVLVLFDPFDWKLAAGKPVESIAHETTLSKVLLFVFGPHFSEAHLYSV